MTSIFVVESDGQLRDAYNAVSYWFDRSALLVVCVDSARDAASLLPVARRFGLEAGVPDNRLLFEPGAARKLFSSEGFLCGFDAMYLFKEAPLPGLAPAYDHTTEGGDLLDPVHSLDLAMELVRCGAEGYVADGCGLFCCTLDPGIARELESKLQDSRTRTVTI